jgi:hypothetical protein
MYIDIFLVNTYDVSQKRQCFNLCCYEVNKNLFVEGCIKSAKKVQAKMNQSSETTPIVVPCEFIMQVNQTKHLDKCFNIEPTSTCHELVKNSEWGMTV